MRQIPNDGRPDLEHVGIPLGGATQGGATKRSPWGPEKEGGCGSVSDPQGLGLLSKGAVSPPLWPGGVQSPAKTLRSEKCKFQFWLCPHVPKAWSLARGALHGASCWSLRQKEKPATLIHPVMNLVFLYHGPFTLVYLFFYFHTKISVLMLSFGAP